MLLILILAVLACMPVFHSLTGLCAYPDAFDQGVSVSQLGAGRHTSGTAITIVSTLILGVSVLSLLRGGISPSTRPQSKPGGDRGVALTLSRLRLSSADADGDGDSSARAIYHSPQALWPAPSAVSQRVLFVLHIPPVLNQA